ncbi:MAG: hypothetical protein K1X75_06685 [Leptospirales bacterium]|nr:hypothetical protein [Leptospirales bacterium]
MNACAKIPAPIGGVLRPSATLLLAAVVLLAAGFCRRGDDWRSAEYRRRYIADRRAAPLEFQGLQPTAEQAALTLARQLAAGGAPGGALLSEQEYTDCYWPNLPASYTDRPELSPASALAAYVSMRDVILSVEGPEFAGADWVKASISWRRPPDTFGVIRLHYPDVIQFTAGNGRKHQTRSFNVILEYKQQFKVAGLSPG